VPITLIPESKNSRFRLSIAAFQTAFFEILLVIVFRSPELRRWHDLRRDAPAIPSRFSTLFFRPLRNQPLFLVVIKNDRAVLCTDIRPLTVDFRRVVIIPKYIQQRFVRDFIRIEFNFDDFGMAGRIAANIFVRRSISLP
jgi:hypothetical protein